VLSALNLNPPAFSWWLFSSHHPEIINYLASGYGYWFEKEANMPVRLQQITENGSGLPISELVARNWLYE